MLANLDLADKLSIFLGASPEEVLHIVQKISNQYKIYKKPKKSGGFRTILHPCRKLKAFQYAINELVLKKFEPHNIAYAYIPGKASPLRRAAEKHTPFRYTLRIDFKDFFPSIRHEDLTPIVKQKYTISNEDNIILRCALFYKGKVNQNGLPFLPIGAPTSPTISNIVMADLDSKISTIADTMDKKSGLSRYADDLYFSTNKKNLCFSFHNAIKALLESTASPKLEINESKTLYLSRGTKRVVNGLFVTQDGRVSIGHERKSIIKSLIYKHSKNRLTQEEIKRAQGILAFIKDCEPDFYNRLALKYGQAFFSINESQ